MESGEPDPDGAQRQRSARRHWEGEAPAEPNSPVSVAVAEARRRHGFLGLGSSVWVEGQKIEGGGCPLTP